MSDLYDYFPAHELACKCGCGRGQQDMDVNMMQWLIGIRRVIGFPLPVSSAFRCPEHNNKVSTTGLSGPHTTGKAVDIKLSGVQAYKLLEILFTDGMWGVGINQKGPHEGRFIHMDLVKPRVWSY